MRRYTVPALDAELDELLRSRFDTILVEGEVAQVQTPVSGHAYIKLRDRGPGDTDCVLDAIVFRGDWANFRYRPQAGERVVCRGRLGMYAARGAVQLYVSAIAPAGEGELARQIAARKARLLAEGLLDPRRKRPLPTHPRFVGIATSTSGAALQDFLAVSRRRFPATRILVAGCAVQGTDAPSSVIRAVELLIEDGRSQIVVVARGGGSKEDLLPFQDEQLARFLATCPVPVVTAVGHQIDTTLVDLVADRAEPTPSAAAAAVLPDRGPLTREVDRRADTLAAAVARQLTSRRRTLLDLEDRLRHPADRIRRARQELTELEPRLAAVVARRLADEGFRTRAMEARLHALSPLGVLDRGYAIVAGPHGVVRKPEDVAPGDPIEVRTVGGTIAARVERRTGGGPQLSLW
jgi:exodeoxyribonuclease VII large subunit